MDAQHSLDFMPPVGGQTIRDPRQIKRGLQTKIHHLDVEPQRLGHLAPTIGKSPRRRHQHLVTLLQSIRQGRLPGPMAIGDINGDMVLGARDLAQVAILGAALSYAFAGVWARKRLTGLTPIVSAAGMLTGSSLIMFPLAWWVEGAPATSFTAETIGAIIYMSVFGTAAAYLLYYRILAAAGSGNLMLVTVIMPPLSIALGWLVLGETLTPESLIGCGMIIAGLIKPEMLVEIEVTAYRG